MSALLLANTLFTARTLGIALWVGLAVLTISLVVLMRTRFGQAQPLSKCVALSVLAHVLLFGYAWGTKLIFDPPPKLPDDYIAVSIRTESEDESAKQQSPKSDSQLAPWDRFPADADVQPEIESPRRQEVTPPESPVRSPSADTAQAVGGPPTAAIERSQPQPPVPPSPDDAELLRHARSGVEAAPIERPRPRQRAEVEPETPSFAELPRRSDAEPRSSPLPNGAPPQMPDELLNIKPRVQHLADPVSRGDGAEAAPDRDEPKAGADRDFQGEADAASADRRTPSPQFTAGSEGAGRAAAPAGETGADSPRVRGTPEGAVAADALLDTSGAPRRLGDGAELPSLYRLRFSPDRLRIARQQGGDAETETAVEAALAWLAAHQEADGRWDASRHGAGVERSVLGHHRESAGADADTGITGLAVLAFLGAGHSHLEGRWRENVQHGLEFLLRSQATDGSLAGDARLFAKMYCHGMASLALSEAYAVTGDHRLKPYVQRAVAYSVAAQHRGSGGWRYQPGDAGDMSQFGWQVMALVSAEHAGIPIPAVTRSGMLRFLSSVSQGRSGGLCSYRPNEAASRTMTAEGLTCRVFLQTTGDAAARREAADFISSEPPAAGQANLYYWYYATLALHQTGSERWPAWNEALKRGLLARQRGDGDAAGSWNPDTRWGGYGGRAYSTALACLCLEVYYRYLPVYVDAPR